MLFEEPDYDDPSKVQSYADAYDKLAYWMHQQSDYPANTGISTTDYFVIDRAAAFLCGEESKHTGMTDEDVTELRSAAHRLWGMQ